LIYVVWALQEWAWNVFPSTNASSAVVVMSLAVQVFGVYFNGSGEEEEEEEGKSDKSGRGKTRVQ
jgi:alpha-1,3-mannosyltransferase